MFLLISGIFIGVLLSLVAILAGKQFFVALNNDKLPYEKQEKGQIIKLEPDLEKLLQK